MAGLFFYLLHGFWDLVSICSCPEPLHWPAPDSLRRPVDGRYSQRGGIPDGFYDVSGGVSVGTDTQL